MDSEVSTKKSKKSKTNKKFKNLAEVPKKEENKGLERKQQELNRILHIKNYELQNRKLSYLDYMELSEELVRLNALQDVFNAMLCGSES